MMMHLSRLSQELTLWCSAEFGFIELSDAFSTGSSINKKKNPDVAELVRGKPACLRPLQGVLTVMKGLPLAYNSDMQEDKEALFDVIDTVKACLRVLAPMLATLTTSRTDARRSRRLAPPPIWPIIWRRRDCPSVRRMRSSGVSCAIASTSSRPWTT